MTDTINRNDRLSEIKAQLADEGFRQSTPPAIKAGLEWAVAEIERLSERVGFSEHINDLVLKQSEQTGYIARLEARLRDEMHDSYKDEFSRKNLERYIDAEMAKLKDGD